MSHPPGPSAASRGPREWSAEQRAQIDEMIARYPTKRSAIMPVLWLAQESFEWIDLDIMRLVGRTLDVPASHVHAVASFYTMFKKAPTGRYVIDVCQTLSCQLLGSDRIIAHLEASLGLDEHGNSADGLFTLHKVECLASCGSAPMMQVNDHFYELLTTESVDEIIAAFRAGKPLSTPRPEADEWQWSPEILTANWGVPGAHTLAVARQRGVYARVAKAMAMQPAEVTQLVKDSGLRGRGGAGFPTGLKWSFVPSKEKRGDKPVYLLCNADESEPGTFKDRYCMWFDPHLLLEGMLIACWALDCHRAYIYLRGEFKFVQDRLDAALAEARAANLVGTNILGKGFDCEIYTHLGAGAYICGEETALISSIEGERGQPKLKPPFPAVEGAWRMPTIVNNVETLQAVPWIVEHGAAAHKAIGTEKSPGTKLFSVSGHVAKPGVYEIPMGITMKSFLEDVCGGVKDGKQLKAVIPGGSSVPVMTADEVMRANMDYESIQTEAGSYLGSGGFIVMDESTDMVAALTNLLRFYAHESCGQCTPCREGCGWMYQILCRVRDRLATPEDLVTLRELADNVHSKTICFFGASAAMPVQSFLTKFRDEFLERVQHPAVPAGVEVTAPSGAA